jgi:hypothetical protein
VQTVAQKAIIRLRNEGGLVPRWFLLVFQFLITIMWVQHDYFNVWIWGRGDGL